MPNSSQRKNRSWQILSLRNRRIFQMEYWLNACFVKKTLDWTIVGIYKQNVTIVLRLVKLQSFVRKNLPSKLVLKILLHTHGVFCFLLTRYHLQYLRHVLWKPNIWTHKFKKSLLTLEPQTTFLPIVHIFLHMKNITMNFKRSKRKYFQRINTVLLSCVEVILMI